MKTILILALLVLVLGTACFFLIKAEIKTKKEIKNLREEIEKERNERKNKDEAKEKLHTGDDVTDFNNSIDVLSHLTQRNK